MSRVRLQQRDLCDGLEGIESDSMDGCLCDPPYGLGFMGKAWDHAVPGPEIWREVLRVLKPGASLLAFGGTRTYHRLACAIEDAGFEIRDSVLVPGAAWIYGQGFPKSLDLSKAIDKLVPRVDLFAPFAAHYKERRAAVGLTHGAICAKGGFHAEHNHGGASVNWESGLGIPTREQWRVLQPLLGLSSDFLPLVERLEAERETISMREGRALEFNPGSGCGAPLAEIITSAPATPSAQRWTGYGTALKPAWEPIVWAMKPLDGTFAANALRYGVAGLNIEGGRIGTSKAVPASPSKGMPEGWGLQNYDGCQGRGGNDPTIGRWPANVILCHLPDCEEMGVREVASNSHHPARRGQGREHLPGHHGQADLEERRPVVETVEAWRCSPGCPVAELDRQSGELSSGFMAAGTQREGIGWNGWVGATVRNDTHADSGGASRFFYCSKVGTAERAGSKHPTLKPIDLCRYLATLILPPARPAAPRRLFVPFAGEGSEIIGALQAGWEEILGVERELEHLEAGAERIRSVAPLIYEVEVELQEIEAEEAATPSA